jgi:hypothetical protein
MNVLDVVVVCRSYGNLYSFLHHVFQALDRIAESAATGRWV